MLFGSAAKGEDARTSDVDVLVEMRDTGLERMIDLERKLTAAAGRASKALRDAGSIDGALCRGLVRAQRARTMIEGCLKLHRLLLSESPALRSAAYSLAT